MEDADVQQGIIVDVVAQSGLRPDAIQAMYRDMGGMCPARQVAAYLQGTAGLPGLQRDLLAHAVNELLERQVNRGPRRRAPYRDHSVAAAAGYEPNSLDGDVLAEHRRRYRRKTRTGQGLLETEDARLESLEVSELLRSSRHDDALSRLPRMARMYFQSLGAAMSLITRDQQITIAADGIPVGRISREESFCSQTVRFDRTLVIEDALTDNRSRTNPFVTGEPRLRFYAGHPIQGPGGYRIGSLCIIDDKPRVFTEGDERKLRTMAALVQVHIASHEWTA